MKLSNEGSRADAMPLVSFHNVEKTYRSLQGVEYGAVEHFSIEIEAGEFFCLLGPSGCGKTTVLKMLAGFEAPTAGHILMDGRPVTGASRDRGVVFQGDDSLYGWLSAIENVEFGLRMQGIARAERRERAMGYLELVGLKGQQQKYPAELSGGMKQRIQIARALVNEPKMLLMDEPFAALDAQTRSLMQLELAGIWRTTRTTVLFITHDIDEAVTLGTRVGVMRAGPRSDVKGVLDVALGFASLFVLWHLASIYLVSSVLFPPPAIVFRKAVILVRNGVLLEHLWASVQRILVGFIAGSLLGIPIGLAMGSFRPLRQVLEPYTEFLRFIPSVAMITVAVIWFGIGEASKIFLIIYTTIFIVILNTAAGVSAIANNKIRAAQALGATRGQIFFHVALPATVPYILTGMRLAMANSFTTIVAAELIAANEVLGKMLWDGRMFMLVDDIFVSLVTLGLLGFAVDRMFRWSIYTFAGKYSPAT